ncbi:restriction endonuclease [Mycobacterium kyorinense]|uniref:Restriction endonuclease type IV Mrr domain-containing protein n=1 Tax=Mycobacterium kyorinense TaxID=487514 RepID=A0A1X1XF08_9MYCO|nr:restriction endonuclease [Mycobacterium kyorinense]ORV97467.1 hypothetical protein AWC14_14800 [Mycobacterium kyorinense]
MDAIATETNLRTTTEELDIVLQNVGQDPRWSTGKPWVIVECKNWSNSVGRHHLDSLESKIRNRSGQCAMGVFVSWNGFTPDFERALGHLVREPYIILTMDGNGITNAVQACDFASYLENRYRVACFHR